MTLVEFRTRLDEIVDGLSLPDSTEVVIVALDGATEAVVGIEHVIELRSCNMGHDHQFVGLRIMLDNRFRYP